MNRRIQRSTPLIAAVAIVGILAVSLTALSQAHVTSVNAADRFDGGSDQARITAAVSRDKPAVVALEVTVNGTQLVPTDPFGDSAPQTVEGRASGSGFVFDAAGTIVTNAHVVSPPNGGEVERIDVLFANGDRIPGRVISVNRAADLALVKVDNYAKLPAPLPLGDSKEVQAGQWAIAIGEPLELRQTVTVGVVSGFDRSEPIGTEDGQSRIFTGLLQTSAPINPGNSGGPLIDMNGRVIGINQSVAGGAQGIGFAIPVDTIRTDVAAMLAGDGTQANSADSAQANAADSAQANSGDSAQANAADSAQANSGDSVSDRQQASSDNSGSDEPQATSGNSGSDDPHANSGDSESGDSQANSRDSGSHDPQANSRDSGSGEAQANSRDSGSNDPQANSESIAAATAM